ncbi:MAG: glycosyltransferase [Deltaproteobacteria bacterium]|jgi:tetratricopeptide (TPR) repeat protein|nr:glycosyltransferase [Deltaproteobacteria bacterium]
MLILSLGSEYFHQAFRQMGHSVLVPPHQEGFRLDDVFNSLQDRPDLIVFTDHLGQHAFPDGLTSIYGIPKVYYAVDSPINFWWQKRFAKLFDYVFVDQKPFAQALAADGLNAQWLPVGVDVQSYSPAPAENRSQLYDFGFVGVLDPARRPKRSRLVEALSGRWTLKTAGNRQAGWLDPAESGQLYRQSRLALNESLFPGVTMRMLEAMASGAVLFTERAGGDLGELFKPGEDFAWFEPDELMSAAERWLGDANRRKRTAKRALEKVAAAHDVRHRAETLLAAVRNLRYGQALVDQEAWEQEGQTMFLTALRWPAEAGQARMSRAEKLLSKADEAKILSPEGLFMLGHIHRMRRRLEPAVDALTRALEQGEPRGALGLGILKLGLGQQAEARQWLDRFLEKFGPGPELTPNTLPFETVKLIAKRLTELGHEMNPGFSRLAHDPAIWTAFEYLQSAFNSRSDDLETARTMAELLLRHGAAAEAQEAAQKGLESHPDDEILGGVYAQASRASYVTVN